MTSRKQRAASGRQRSSTTSTGAYTPPKQFEVYEQHGEWTHYFSPSRAKDLVHVTRKDGRTKVYEGDSARTFLLRSSGHTDDEIADIVASVADQNEAEHEADETQAEEPALDFTADLAVFAIDTGDGTKIHVSPVIDCPCGCGRRYPATWVRELIPFVKEVRKDGRLDLLQHLPQVGYAESLPWASAQSRNGFLSLFSAPGGVFDIPDVTAPTLVRAAQRWDTADMNNFADLVHEAVYCAIVVAFGGLPPSWSD